MTNQIDRPLLRVMKCAVKLHRAGLTLAETVQYINNCRWCIDQGRKTFPSAALPPSEILWQSFVWADSVEGNRYWLHITERMEAAEAKC